MGGMQNAMVNLANGLVNTGITVEMYALFKLEHFFNLDQKIRFSESSISPKHYNIITRMIATIHNIRRIARKSESQIIIVYGKFYSALTLMATIGLNRHIFISDRTSPLYKDRWYVELITSIVYFFKKPTGIIAQTNDSAKYQRERFGTNMPIEVIPNFVRDIKIYNHLKEKIVLAVGRFGDKLKGFDRLVEAWGKVNAQDWRLIFAGGLEHEEPDLINRAKALGVYYSLDCLGKVKDMDDLYSRSSIFVIPSRCEGFPNALAEAMSAGLACISFDFIAGPRDMINDGYNGYIVPNGDIDALAEKIQYLLEHENERKILMHNATLIRKVLSPELLIEKYLNFIYNCIYGNK